MLPGLTVVLFSLFQLTYCQYNIAYQTPSDCRRGNSDDYHEFFDISQLECTRCAQTSEYQTASADGLRCVCQPGMRITHDFGGINLECLPCPDGQMTSQSGWECVECDSVSADPNEICLPCKANNHEISGEIVRFNIDSVLVLCYLITLGYFIHEVTSSDGWGCVNCGRANPFNPVENVCTICDGDQITVERQLDGRWENSLRRQTCTECAAETSPDGDGFQCERCNQILSVLPSASNCLCPVDNQAGGMCFESSDDINYDTSQLYRVTFGDVNFDSMYFYENVEAAAGMCAVKYGNLTACQQLGNLCTLTFYTRENEGSALTQDACSLFIAIAKDYGGSQRSQENCNLTGCQLLGNMCVMLMYSHTRVNMAAQDACSIYDELLKASKGFKRNDDWPPNMPWLYYFEDADRVLTDTTIPTEFTFPNMALPLKAAKFTVNGTFLGYEDVTNGLLQLCKNSRSILDAAFIFGTTYDQKCEFSVSDLFKTSEDEMFFYDLYLEYEDKGQKQLYAVPALVRNYVDSNGRKVNEDSDDREWQLTRRFFLIDILSGIQDASTPAGSPVASPQAASSLRAVRYAAKMTLHVKLQSGQSSGLINPPYIEILYDHATIEDLEADKSVKVEFAVDYRMHLGKYNKDISIAVGTLSGLAFIYSFFLTWGWSRRAGKIAIDFITLTKFFVHLCGSLANVFFIVTFGASLWWWIFYKRQTSVYLIVPGDAQNEPFVAYLASAFALKFLQLIHMIICQITVDIFFVDWERPQGGAVQSSGEGKSKEASVSIWRTYFVANEWNEIQTCRKINPIFQLFVVLFFLEVIGFGNLATQDPKSSFSLSSDEYHSPFSETFRFCIIALTYLLVALVQWMFHTFIYERFVEDKVRQYVDLCSMSNVSVFILENEMFGYYIHGRSVHGRADTGMKEMAENLRREEEDLCGQRGLMPNTEQQTFQMAVPRKLRHQYDRVIQPIQNPGQGAGNAGRTGGRGSQIDPQTQKSLHAYSILNRFLQGFIDHSLRDVDYIIKDKVLLENVLDMEFTDPVEQGFFYNDSGHSFDSVLFFGNEMTLTVFEILFFALVDVIFHNYTLAAVLTFILMQVIRMIRDSLGQNNLASKTLVDKRFLI